MAKVSAMWRALPDQEKAEFMARSVIAQREGSCTDLQHDLDLGDLAFPNSASPFGIGSETSPMRDDLAEPLCIGHAIAEGKQAWRRLTGASIPVPKSSYEADDIPAPICGELYGPFQCAGRLHGDVKELAAYFISVFLISDSLC